MRKMMAVWFVVITMALWCGLMTAYAQEAGQGAKLDEIEQQLKARQDQEEGQAAKLDEIARQLKTLELRLAGKSSAEENKPRPEPKSEQPEKRVHAYRLDFSLNELEDGKKVNARHYSMNSNAGDRNQIKIGARIPVPTGPFDARGGNPLTNFQYMSVNTVINCQLEEHGDVLALEVHSEISNFATPGEQHTAPVVREININGSTVATPGKPIVMGSVDDPNSNHQFQLEVTATKLR